LPAHDRHGRTEILPTGRRLAAPYTCVHQLAGDRIATSRFYFDQMDLLDQLGLTGG